MTVEEYLAAYERGEKPPGKIFFCDCCEKEFVRLRRHAGGTIAGLKRYNSKGITYCDECKANKFTGPKKTHKLNSQAVFEIRDLHHNGIFKQKELAELYGVSYVTVNRVINGWIYK